MKRGFVLSKLIVFVGMLLAFGPLPAAAQDVTAQVRTWTGQTWRLSEPWIEVSYTVMPQPKEEAPGAAAMAGLPGTGETRPEIRGSFQSIRQFFGDSAEPQRAQRDLDILTLSSAGVDVRVPVGKLVSLTISRGLVAESPLPPYIAASHYRYSAVAQLSDGSRVEADHFNFGTAVVRGTTAGGQVEISFAEIQSLQFER